MELGQLPPELLKAAEGTPVVPLGQGALIVATARPADLGEGHGTTNQWAPVLPPLEPLLQGWRAELQTKATRKGLEQPRPQGRRR